MKKNIKRIIYKFFNLIYKEFNNSNYSIKRLFLLAFFQKIIGINRLTPWPVHFTSQIKDPHKIKNGTKNPGSAMSCYIDARNGITIEDNVFIGPKVSIISQNHSLGDYNQYIETKPIVIGKNCLLLTNCVILPEVELGEHTVVAAGSVVTKSFVEGNQLIGGVPAKVIKKLGTYKGK